MVSKLLAMFLKELILCPVVIDESRMTTTPIKGKSLLVAKVKYIFHTMTVSSIPPTSHSGIQITLACHKIPRMTAREPRYTNWPEQGQGSRTAVHGSQLAPAIPGHFLRKKFQYLPFTKGGIMVKCLFRLVLPPLLTKGSFVAPPFRKGRWVGISRAGRFE